MRLLKERRHFYYDAAWRAIVEEIDDDVGSTAPDSVDGLATVPGTDRVAQQLFGLRGLNDAVFRREDRTEYHPEVWDENFENLLEEAHTDPPDGDFDGGHDIRVYQLSDHQLSVVRVLLDVDRTFWYPGNDVEYDPCRKSRRILRRPFGKPRFPCGK